MPPRIFVFDNPRSNCQLFYKLFHQHPQLDWGKFHQGFASAATYGPERLQLRTRHCEAAERAQLQGKIFFGKEHVCLATKQDIMLSNLRKGTSLEVQTNPTYIPDDIMDTLTPVFVFRHPALSIPSMYRVDHDLSGLVPSDEDFELWTSLRWSRMLYDYFDSKQQTPAVVEAQDFVYNTTGTLNALCRRLGIDENGWTETWEPTPQEYLPDSKIVTTMLGDLFSSSGIRRRANGPPELTLCLDTEFEKWQVDFGDEVAQGIRRLVEAEIPYYEYLRSRRLTV